MPANSIEAKYCPSYIRFPACRKPESDELRRPAPLADLPIASANWRPRPSDAVPDSAERVEREKNAGLGSKRGLLVSSLSATGGTPQEESEDEPGYESRRTRNQRMLIQFVELLLGGHSKLVKQLLS